VKPLGKRVVERVVKVRGQIRSKAINLKENYQVGSGELYSPPFPPPFLTNISFQKKASGGVSGSQIML
jgi:hypothetical protein